MNILVLGSGGREHAIVRKLKESPRVSALYCAPGNGGIAKDAVCVPIGVMDKEKVVAFAKEKAVDLVFVAPDDPLAAGMVDALEEAGIPAAFIGKITDSNDRIILNGENCRYLNRPGADEIEKLGIK